MLIYVRPDIVFNKHRRVIVVKTRLYLNEDIQPQCKLSDIIKFTKVCRREWNNHVSRAIDFRLICIAMDLKL